MSEKDGPIMVVTCKKCKRMYTFAAKLPPFRVRCSYCHWWIVVAK